MDFSLDFDFYFDFSEEFSLSLLKDYFFYLL